MAGRNIQRGSAGRTWQEIGDLLGVTRQAAFQRYGKPIDPRTGDVMSTSPITFREDQTIAGLFILNPSA